jgi:Cu/Ag efflux pump CusA
MNDWVITKRQLGIFLLISGVAGFVGLFALDAVRGRALGDLGPTQSLALAACVLLALVGASLIPLGGRPA